MDSTFPSKKYDSISDYADDYMGQLVIAAKSIDKNELERAAKLLNEVFERDSQLYACGNGGSAAIANHLQCDYAKCIQTDTNIIPRASSLSANIELITAIANDITYDDIFVYQLRTMARPGDVVMTISASGDSENIVRTVEWARENDITTIALSGFDGGRSSRMADVNLHVEGTNYGVIEDTHQSIMHIIAQYLRQDLMDESTIMKRKF